jgi:hypothetical protein
VVARGHAWKMGKQSYGIGESSNAWSA